MRDNVRNDRIFSKVAEGVLELVFRWILHLVFLGGGERRGCGVNLILRDVYMGFGLFYHIGFS